MEAVSCSRRLHTRGLNMRKTLHAQYDTVEGERRLVKLRATVPAEVFFQSGHTGRYAAQDRVFQASARHPDRHRHHRHLCRSARGPAELSGRHRFRPAAGESCRTDAWGSRSLHCLGGCDRRRNVRDLHRKFLLNRCYERAETLAQAIDHRYEAGAGEEYLSRLVDSAAESATQNLPAQDALVNDLERASRRFRTRFRSRSPAGCAHIGDRLTRLDTGLSGAISRCHRRGTARTDGWITRVAETVGGHQGKAVEDLMSALIGKIESTFGGQMSGPQ